MQERMRDSEAEMRERRRYEVLERLYALTGPGCDTPVGEQAMEKELGFSAAQALRVAKELTRLGYLRPAGREAELCLTGKAVDYLSIGAWRRRSVRG